MIFVYYHHLVEKLIGDSTNEVTIYIDRGIHSEFMQHVVHDLQTMPGNEILTTESQVRLLYNRSSADILSVWLLPVRMSALITTE